VIARMWRGATALDDADSYVEYLRRTGLADYRSTPGNVAAWILWREVDDRAEFIALTLWETEDAIARFAGEDISRAVFYPEDDRYLIERDETVSHYRVVDGSTRSP